MGIGTVHSSNMGLVSSELPIGKYGSENFLIIFDTDLQDDQWGIYNGSRMISGPHPIADEKMADHMRRTFQKLGLTPATKPREEPEEAEAPAPKVKTKQRSDAAPAPPKISLAPLPDPVTVTDEESGAVVNVDSPTVAQAMDVHKEIQVHWESGWRHLLSLGLSLKKLVDGKLYLALGFSSLEAYAQAFFGSSRYWIYDRVAIAAKLQAAGVDPVSVDSGQQFPSISRLRAALPLAADQYAALIRGEMAGPSGEAKPLAEMSGPEIRAVVKSEVSPPAAEPATKPELVDEPEPPPLEPTAPTVPAQPPPTVPTPLPPTPPQPPAKPAAEPLIPVTDPTTGRKHIVSPDSELAKQEAAHKRRIAAEARGVNKTLATLRKVATESQEVLKAANAKESGDQIDLAVLYQTVETLEAVIRELAQIAKDCGRH